MHYLYEFFLNKASFQLSSNASIFTVIIFFLCVGFVWNKLFINITYQLEQHINSTKASNESSSPTKINCFFYSRHHEDNLPPVCVPCCYVCGKCVCLNTNLFKALGLQLKKILSWKNCNSNFVLLSCFIGQRSRSRQYRTMHQK